MVMNGRSPLACNLSIVSISLLGSWIFDVELPRATEDIFGDDSCQVRLDAKEFLSEVGVLDFRQTFGPQLEMRWQRKLLLVPY